MYITPLKTFIICEVLVFTNVLLDYIFFFYLPNLQNFKIIKSINISSITYLNFKFLYFKISIKNECIDQIVNNYQIEKKNVMCVKNIKKKNLKFLNINSIKKNSFEKQNYYNLKLRNKIKLDNVHVSYIIRNC